MCAFQLSFLLCSTQYTLCNVHCVFVSILNQSFRQEIHIANGDPKQQLVNVLTLLRFSAVCVYKKVSLNRTFLKTLGYQVDELPHKVPGNLWSMSILRVEKSIINLIVGSIFFAFFTFLTVSVHKRHILVKNRWFQSKQFFPWHDISYAQGLTIYLQ